MRSAQFFKTGVLLLGFFVLVGRTEAETLPLTFKANSYQLAKDAEGYDVLKMAGFETAAVPGRPILPHKIVNLALPPDVDTETITLLVTAEETERRPGFYTVKICPPDTAWNGVQWLRSTLDTNESRPDAAVRLIGVSQMRKWKFVTVEFAPFRYIPGTGELILAKKIEGLLSFDRTGDLPGALELQDSVMDDIARDLFLNYSQAKEWYESGVAGAEISQILPTNYVIITTEAIRTNSTKLSAFIAHKQDMGFTVEVVTETTWGTVTGQSPNTKAEKIREWLKAHYLSLGIKYVLLIGNPSPYESGEGDVPMKMCWPRLGAGSDENAPTDYFYADLTGNWNKDGDAYFGEWSQDMGTGGVDFAPEVYVGRIPVYSGATSTLDAILQKIITYERTTGSLAWRKSALLPMGFQAAGYDGAMLAEQMRDDYLVGAGYSTWRQYQQGTAFASDNSIYTSEEELRGNTIVRDRWAANDYGIVCWWGHGSATSASVGYSPNWDGTLFSYSYCSSLDDAHPSFTYQCSCTNAYPENSNNLAYSILKAGGVETVSATRVSWFNTGVLYGGFDGSTTNSGIGYEYIKRLVVSEYAAGNALYLAKASMTPESATRLMNYYDFNLYGDPSLSLQKVYQGDDRKHAVGDFDGDGADEAAIDFGSIGAWMWNGGAWSQLTPNNPERMIAFNIDGDGDAEIAVDLGASGLWVWNGGVWSLLSGSNAEDIIATDTNHNAVEELIVDFGAAGLWWRQESGTFSLLSTLDPQQLISADLDANGNDEVIADFGMIGLWRWESAGGTWTQLTAADINALAAADVDHDGDDGIAAGLVSYGVWLWDSGAWTQLSGVPPDRLMAGDMVAGGGTEIAGDFGSIGLWLWTAGGWIQVSGANPDNMITADVDANGVDEVVSDFGGLGLWMRNGGVWSHLSGANPEALLAGDIDADGRDELLVDFGSLGVWLWNDGSWTNISSGNPD